MVKYLTKDENNHTLGQIIELVGDSELVIVIEWGDIARIEEEMSKNSYYNTNISFVVYNKEDMGIIKTVCNVMTKEKALLTIGMEDEMMCKLVENLSEYDKVYAIN